MAAEPIDHVTEHRDRYAGIERKLDSVRESFLQADRGTQSVALHRAVTFALLSAQVPVDDHELAYVEYLDVDTQDEMVDRVDFINYYRNKARYVFENLADADADAVIDKLEAGDLDDAHRTLRDEFLGVGLRKAAFALAMLGFTEKRCIDAHVMKMVGLDDDSVYNGVVVDTYEEQCELMDEAFPELVDEGLPPFLRQWVVFDSDLETVTQHDPWFLSLPDEIAPDAV